MGILEEEQMHWAVQHTTGCALLGQPPDRVTVLMDFVTRNDYNTPQVIEDYQKTIHQLLDGSAKSVGFAVLLQSLDFLCGKHCKWIARDTFVGFSKSNSF